MNSDYDNQRANIIKINVHLNDEKFVLTTHPNEYRSLMHLIKDNTFLDDFGECSGEGRCSTCVVEILSDKNKIAAPSGNENATLIKHNLAGTNSRLSCQIMLNFNCDQLTVRLL